MNIIRDIEQGSDEWRNLRRGKITGTGAAAIITEPRTVAAKTAGELSATATTYLRSLLADVLVEPNEKQFSAPATDWGKEHEDTAATLYCALTGQQTEKVCFVEWSDWVGVSPDRLIGEDGGLEIKCPFETKVHISYLELQTPADLEKEEKDYFWQVLFNLFVTGRQWWDFISYDPRMREPFQLKTLRFNRAEFEPQLAALEKAVNRSVEWLQRKTIQYL